MIEKIFLFMETISIMIFYLTLNKNRQWESFLFWVPEKLGIKLWF